MLDDEDEETRLSACYALKYLEVYFYLSGYVNEIFNRVNDMSSRSPIFNRVPSDNVTKIFL